MENGGLIYWEGKKLLHRQLLRLMDHLLILGVSSTTGVCNSILDKVVKRVDHGFIQTTSDTSDL